MNNRNMNTSIKFFRILLILFVVIAFSATQAMAQQLYPNSQYMANLTPQNAAYSLLDKNGAVNALVQKQWVGVNGAPSTFIMDGSIPIESVNGSAGAIIMNDQLAVEQLTNINVFFAKSIQLSSGEYLGVSLNAGLQKYVANYSSLATNDPSFRNDVRQSRPNLGFGVIYYSAKYYIGLSVPQLTVSSLGTASVQGNDYFHNHYNLAAAYLFGDEQQDIQVKPALLASYTNGLPTEVNFSTTLYLKSTIGIGANYCNDKQAAGIMSIILHNFRLGYSYQFNTASNNFSSFNNSTHEVTLSYRFGHHLDEINLL
jgi:type IX secretion system PorP/SprF family membrane protein